MATRSQFNPARTQREELLMELGFTCTRIECPVCGGATWLKDYDLPEPDGSTIITCPVCEYVIDHHPKIA